MKYAKVKDDIIDMGESTYTTNDIRRWFGEDCILAESDDVAELCDCFVCHVHKNPPDMHIFDNLNDAFDYAGVGTPIYGSIWCFNKLGAPVLKPVVKINYDNSREMLHR